MGQRGKERLDALLGPMLELEARLRAEDGDRDHLLDEGNVHLLREAHGLLLASDECELILPTDAHVAGRPDDPFERDA